MNWKNTERGIALKEMKMELHESVRDTYKEMVIKESEGFRLTLKKHEVLSPKGLFSVDLVNETIKEDGTVGQTSTYNYFMTKEELQALAYGLTL
jgi:uncharacterized protein YneR